MRALVTPLLHPNCNTLFFSERNKNSAFNNNSVNIVYTTYNIYILYEYITKTPRICLLKMCIYSSMLKLQLPSKYSPFDAIHLLRLFSSTQNSCWTRRFWCLLVLLLFFVSPLLHQQIISLCDFFHLRKQINKQKSHSGPDPVNREGGAQESCCFWSKTAEHSALCGQVCC